MSSSSPSQVSSEGTGDSVLRASMSEYRLELRGNLSTALMESWHPIALCRNTALSTAGLSLLTSVSQLQPAEEGSYNTVQPNRSKVSVIKTVDHRSPQLRQRSRSQAREEHIPMQSSA